MAEKDYKSTLALPRTDFPMKANLPKREPELLKRWDDLDLYARLMAARAAKPLWVLHDGPPYANGRVHLGTALNKILKDFIVRSRSMLGFRTPFVPGWDCHGMPIELKVARALGERARTMPKIELRKLCRAEAEKWIELQRQDFRRLGCIGDWQHPYLTMAPEYDSAEIGILRKLVAAGYVYRGKRPVHWCFDCRTALAEAEVEYSDHTSPSIYVAFALNSNLKDAGALAAKSSDAADLATAHRAGKLFAVIWTTTPWTLPANLGISLNATLDYVALKAADRWYIVAARLADAVAEACGIKVEKQIALSRDAIKALDGKDVFTHPFIARSAKLMYADHVTADTGTGLVHTAPGHGYEDFVVGTVYGLPTYTPVDDSGVFTKDAGEWAGQNVFKANDSIVEKLRSVGALLGAQKIAHSYPHCWRCKNPLIFRATEQWFLRIEHENLRQRIIEQIDAVTWLPAWSRDRIRNMTETRPDWCLSRQRAWGVPIPALKCGKCEEVFLDDAVMRRAAEIFAVEGSDAWFARPLADFVGAGLKCPKCGATDLTKEENVLDVWFDSGCSQAAVLAKRPELRWPADAYVEGVDQARGWFASSLALACAASDGGGAPFTMVVNHGFTVDEKGQKMSKSLGNAEDVVDVANRLGADVIRLVYASLDYSSEMALGQAVFNAVSESYRKIRNTCRYLLSNLVDFDPARDLAAYDSLMEFDRFILMRLERLKSDVRAAFERCDFRGAYAALVNFIVIDLSSLYIDVARDRLYCAGATSPQRRSAQTTLFHLLDAIVRMLAPLVPYTADEVYSFMPGARRESVHLLELQPPMPQWESAELAGRWERLLRIRDEALKLLEDMRKAGAIGAPLEAAVSLGVDSAAEISSMLSKDPRSLKDLFIVSEVSLLGTDDAAKLRSAAAGREGFADNGNFVRVGDGLALSGRRAPGIKCQRCWCYFDDGGDPDLCERCRAVVRA